MFCKDLAKIYLEGASVLQRNFEFDQTSRQILSSVIWLQAGSLLKLQFHLQLLSTGAAAGHSELQQKCLVGTFKCQLSPEKSVTGLIYITGLFSGYNNLQWKSYLNCKNVLWAGPKLQTLLTRMLDTRQLGKCIKLISVLDPMEKPCRRKEQRRAFPNSPSPFKPFKTIGTYKLNSISVQSC